MVHFINITCADSFHSSHICSAYAYIICQETYNINEISHDYKTLVINESHSVEKNGIITSTLAIFANVLPYKEFRCEFVLRDYSICAMIIRMSPGRDCLRPNSHLP